MMSINSLRPNPYRPPNQPKPLQPRFGTSPEGDGDDPKAEAPPNLPLSPDEIELAKQKLRYALEQKEALDFEIRLTKAALGITQEDGPDPVSQSAEAKASEANAKAGYVPGEGADTDHQEAQAPLKSKYTPRSERTRLNVGWDITKEYMGSNQVWLDMGICVAVGAVCAIGSPVMAVTIPTTMMVVGGYRLMLLAIKMFQDPQGDNIDNMYQTWMKAEAEQAKKKAEPSS
jgi:hypothetical protein